MIDFQIVHKYQGTEYINITRGKNGILFSLIYINVVVKSTPNMYSRHHMHVLR